MERDFARKPERSILSSTNSTSYIYRTFHLPKVFMTAYAHICIHNTGISYLFNKNIIRKYGLFKSTLKRQKP